MKKLERFLTIWFTNIVVLFAVAFLTKIVLDVIIFGQNTADYRYIYLQLVFIAIGGLILALIAQVNRISKIVQALVTFVVMTAEIYFYGFLSGWFSIEHLEFTIISFVFNLIGVITISLIVLIRSKIQNHELNQQLKDYKERKPNEKN